MKLLWLSLMATIACSLPAQARSFGEFQVGSWYGAAHTDEKGDFNHCGAYTHMRDNTMVLFGIGREFRWSVAFNHRKWKLEVGDPIPVMFGVDDMEPLQFDARAYMRNGVEIGLGERADLFRQFRRGRILKVLGTPKPIEFPLKGVDQLLPRLWLALCLEERNRAKSLCEIPPQIFQITRPDRFDLTRRWSLKRQR